VKHSLCQGAGQRSSLLLPARWHPACEGLNKGARRTATPRTQGVGFGSSAEEHKPQAREGQKQPFSFRRGLVLFDRSGSAAGAAGSDWSARAVCII